jgi:integrase
MANILRLRFLKAYLDRHWKARHYLRKPGCKPVALPGLVGSGEFMRVYGEALAGTSPPQTEIGATRTRVGSIASMVIGFFASAQFHNLAPATQQQYRRILERLRREHGDRSIATLERRHVIMMVDARAKTPVGARDFLRCLRLLTQYAIRIGLIESDPTSDVRVKMPKSDGHPTWGEPDIARFRAHYKNGTMARLALELLLNTATRRADVVRLSRGHIRGNAIHGIRQQKTGRTLPPIPIRADLAAALNATPPTDALVLLVDEGGKPFSAERFTKWFRRQCKRAGLHGLTPHGLRKAACRRLAEAGSSEKEIAAISGHASLNEVARYTRAADQARLARNAMERLDRKEGQHGLSNPTAESV